MSDCSFVASFETLEPRRLLAGTVSGVVWDDLNGNGVRDAGEPGLANQSIFLDKNSNGIPGKGERTAVTDSNGQYTLTNLAPGDLHLRYDVPAGRRLTAPSAIVYNLTVTANEVFIARNFASSTMGVLRGKVFNDTNGDGIQQAGEQPLVGWRIFIDKNKNGVFDEDLERYRLTNSLGEYRFANLAPGQYVIRIQTQIGFHLTNPPGGGFTINVTAGKSFSNRNFAEQPLDNS